ncbi:hypothetical protein JYK02_06830 [Corallococcus macrosporus]|uniref:Uncharacterized protein n=1 Tax=Corallococcus macrosporus TaxID=35 RepID=A0ABS3D6C7_9BACT|nr:hypothetical protein [Corallococcus macrosporus]MBN8227224.1 hypothetical protein [Corallococcus macrosporus]
MRLSLFPKALPPPTPKAAPPPPGRDAGGQAAARKAHALSTTGFEPATSGKSSARLGEPEYARARPGGTLSDPFFPRDLTVGGGDSGSAQASGGFGSSWDRILNGPLRQMLQDALGGGGDGLKQVGHAVREFLERWVPGKQIRNTDSSSGEGDSRSASPTANGSGTRNV